MNQYAQYNNSKILTASPAELTLMLYDGAIKFNNIAIMAIEKKDIEKAHNNIVKVEKIINEFRATLDSKYEISKDFDRVYVYMLQRLLEANVKKDPPRPMLATGPNPRPMAMARPRRPRRPPKRSSRNTWWKRTRTRAVCSSLRLRPRCSRRRKRHPSRPP